jgi:uncharacterized protein YdeI (YjbR/CyaY-like superfamily)
VRVVHFESAADFRRWLAANQAKATELQVGFYKKDSGKGGLTYVEAVEQALCYGWIDGITHRIDARRFTVRFTPRRPTSNWSLINLARVKRLTQAGQMRAAGLKALAARQKNKTGVYSFEQAAAKLPAAAEKKFRANKKAWAFFSTQAPWYRRLMIHKIVRSKQAATRERWLAQVIADSAAGRRVGAIAKYQKPSA